MRHISLLDERTIGKIAAGEVIDRPASVLKELLENSIDADSRHIIVRVGNGGKEYIQVIEDGCGISEEDVEAAFEKHATSKIRRIDDLASLQTLGFRGEALPSIAAVSRVEMSTRNEKEDWGTYLRIEGGVKKERRRVSRSVGTTIEVRNLLYNLPARIATIKSKSVELKHIMDIFTNYALIYPHIKFELHHDEKLMVKTLGRGKMIESIVNIYGSSVAQELIELDRELNQKVSPEANAAALISINGYISKPSTSYSTKKYLLGYVNGRFVRSELIDKAIKRGYRSLLSKHAYPFAVISLYIDPSEINVNIHPKKHEISFYRASEVFHSIVEAVSTTLRQADLIPEITDTDKDAGVIDWGLPRKEKQISSESEPIQTSLQVNTCIEGDEREKEEKTKTSLDISAVPLYQVLDSYIIAQSEDGDIIIIDQHAAAERINFERIVARYGGRIDKQVLLSPYVPELSPHQLCLIKDNEEALKAMGFDIDRFGEDGYIIRAIPVIFHGMIKGEEIAGVIEDLVDKGKKEEQVKVLFRTAACRASVKAGDKLSYEGMRGIVEGLKNTKIPYTCPHGRPTMIRLSKKEIEKRFYRR